MDVLPDPVGGEQEVGRGPGFEGGPIKLTCYLMPGSVAERVLACTLILRSV